MPSSPMVWILKQKKMNNEKNNLMQKFCFKNKCLDYIVLRCMIMQLLRNGKCYPERWGLNIDKEIIARKENLNYRVSQMIDFAREN